PAAAAPGSGAAVMGRPMTSRSAPEARASSGVATLAWSCAAAPCGRTPGVMSVTSGPTSARTAAASLRSAEHPAELHSLPRLLSPPLSPTRASPDLPRRRAARVRRRRDGAADDEQVRAGGQGLLRRRHSRLVLCGRAVRPYAGRDERHLRAHLGAYRRGLH